MGMGGGRWNEEAWAESEGEIKTSEGNAGKRRENVERLGLGVTMWNKGEGSRREEDVRNEEGSLEAEAEGSSGRALVARPEGLHPEVKRLLLRGTGRVVGLLLLLEVLLVLLVVMLSWRGRRGIPLVLLSRARTMQGQFRARSGRTRRDERVERRKREPRRRPHAAGRARCCGIPGPRPR